MSTVNDTFLEIVQDEEGGFWLVVDEHGFAVVNCIPTREEAIVTMQEVQQSWHEYRMEDGN